MTVRAESVLNGVAVAWLAVAMTGTEKVVSETLDLEDIVAGAAFVADWTNDDSVAGEFTVELSNDGVVWFPMSVDNGEINTAGPALFEFSTHCRYARLAYKNTTGEGTLGALSVHGNRR
jgi:hypothetical protein